MRVCLTAVCTVLHASVMVTVCLTTCVYRVTSECSGQDLYKVLVYRGKQSTSLNDIQNLTELGVIWVVAAQIWGSILKSHIFSFRFVGDVEKMCKHYRSNVIYFFLGNSPASEF